MTCIFFHSFFQHIVIKSRMSFLVFLLLKTCVAGAKVRKLSICGMLEWYLLAPYLDYIYISLGHISVLGCTHASKSHAIFHLSTYCLEDFQTIKMYSSLVNYDLYWNHIECNYCIYVWSCNWINFHALHWREMKCITLKIWPLISKQPGKNNLA